MCIILDKLVYIKFKKKTFLSYYYYYFFLFLFLLLLDKIVFSPYIHKHVLDKNILDVKIQSHVSCTALITVVCVIVAYTWILRLLYNKCAELDQSCRLTRVKSS